MDSADDKSVILGMKGEREECSEGEGAAYDKFFKTREEKKVGAGQKTLRFIDEVEECT